LGLLIGWLLVRVQSEEQLQVSESAYCRLKIDLR
jgi:hypothetical protein